MKLRHISLPAPLLSPAHIDKKIICIRGHRERIFNTDIILEHDKLICHNYGQGGAGWTFLFGCVNHVIQHFEQLVQSQPHFKNQSIAVVGAGCYGLLTAIMLHQRRYTVRILTRDHPEKSSSTKAAGFFFPRPRQSSSPHECGIFHKLGRASYMTYKDIASGNHPFIHAGAHVVPAYYDSTINPGFDSYIGDTIMAPPEPVIVTFGNSPSYRMLEYQSIFMDAHALFTELQRNVASLHIPLLYQNVTTWHDLPESIIFNCTGWGAKQLTNDPRLLPVQGHLITLRNQPRTLQYMINTKVAMRSRKGYIRDELLYYAPKREGILGITFLRGQNGSDDNDYEFDRILERCRIFFGT